MSGEQTRNSTNPSARIEKRDSGLGSITEESTHAAIDEENGYIDVDEGIKKKPKIDSEEVPPVAPERASKKEPPVVPKRKNTPLSQTPETLKSVGLEPTYLEPRSLQNPPSTTPTEPHYEAIKEHLYETIADVKKKMNDTNISTSQHPAGRPLPLTSPEPIYETPVPLYAEIDEKNGYIKIDAKQEPNLLQETPSTFPTEPHYVQPVPLNTSRKGRDEQSVPMAAPTYETPVPLYAEIDDTNISTLQHSARRPLPPLPRSTTKPTAKVENRKESIYETIDQVEPTNEVANHVYVDLATIASQDSSFSPSISPPSSTTTSRRGSPFYEEAKVTTPPSPITSTEKHISALNPEGNTREKPATIETTPKPNKKTTLSKLYNNSLKVLNQVRNTVSNFIPGNASTPYTHLDSDNYTPLNPGKNPSRHGGKNPSQHGGRE